VRKLAPNNIVDYANTLRMRTPIPVDRLTLRVTRNELDALKDWLRARATLVSPDQAALYDIDEVRLFGVKIVADLP
jgi:hypothetical protein